MQHVPHLTILGIFRDVTVTAVALAASLWLATPAQATTLAQPAGLTPFADTTLPGTTSAARPELAGTVLADVMTPFSFAGTSGSVQSRVVREDGSGTLDFYWRVIVDDNTNVGVSALRLADFGYAALTDADWRSDGSGTTAPTVARLFNVGNYPGGAINFLWDQGVMPGKSSRFFFLHTAATSYSQDAFFDLLSTGEQELSGAFATFSPSAVPEPASVALLAAGLLLTVARLRPSRG